MTTQRTRMWPAPADVDPQALAWSETHTFERPDFDIDDLSLIHI